ncbi:hypothetical protein PInf_010510 [Phytophthora infestans]|nr:hypothetical protein PInf_010510 [Phytophthora infestans]
MESVTNDNGVSDKGKHAPTTNENVAELPLSAVHLNEASRPSGRPRLQQAVKKSKRKKEYKESHELAGRLTTIGDVTLAKFAELALHEAITLSEIEDVFSGLQLMHADALFKRPKAKLLTDLSSDACETKVRGILPVALVKKCISAIENVILRKKANNGRDVSHDDVAVVILKVGTFRAADIAHMQQWHSMASVVRGAKALVSWIKSVKIENPDDEEERNAIVETVLELNLRGSNNSGGVSVEFAELARFGDDGWLSDQCLMSATQRIAAEASWNPPPNIHVIN